MTREEAVKRLYELQFYCASEADSGENGCGMWQNDVDALDMAISALGEHLVTDYNQRVSNAESALTNTENALTNADHIRSMTDEELAEFLCRVDVRKGATDMVGWESWLKQPYKDGD